MDIDLKMLHAGISEQIGRLDFSMLWPGFSPLRFALYTNQECCFDGEFIEKTDAFCANTSIEYEGEQIAIWMVSEELDPAVFASKLVHEMFHGFQTKCGWNCFPNETEALFRYRYDAETLAMKLRENELLLGLLDGADGGKLSELFALRSERKARSPYETEYEAMEEELEGSANYVEWKVLEQLAPEKAAGLIGDMRARLLSPERLLPARIPCYYTGALLINALCAAGLYDREQGSLRSAVSRLYKAEPPIKPLDPGLFRLSEAAEAIRAYDAETERIVNAALKRGNKLLEGPLTLGCPNIYNARRLGDFITSTYFLMYFDNGESRFISGDFVIRMLDPNTIETVYEWPRES